MGVTGASGAIYAVRTTAALLDLGCHLDVVVSEQRVEVRVGPVDTERARARRPTLRTAAEDATQLDPDAAKGFDVDRPDEPGPDDGSADVGDPDHAGATLSSAQLSRPSR